MKNSISIIVGLSLLLGLTFNSCNIDEFSDIEKVTVNPELVAPIAFGELRLDSIFFNNVKDTSSVYVDKDGKIHFKYEMDSLFAYSASDFKNNVTVNIPSQTINLGQLSSSIPVPEIQTAINNGAQVPTNPPFPDYSINMQPYSTSNISAGADFDSVMFDTGSITFSLTNNFPFAIKSIKFNVISVSSGDIIAKLEKTNVSSGSSASETTDLKGKSMGNSIKIQITELLTDPINGHTLNTSQSISIDVSVANLAFEYIQGNFTQPAINIPSGEFDLMGDFIEEKYLNSITFGNPEMKLMISSSVGISTGMNMTLDANNSKNTKSESLTINSVIDHSSIVGVTHKDSIVVNTTSNPTLPDFLALPPAKVTYSGNVTINPGGYDPAKPNYLTKDSKVKVGLIADIPLDIKIENLSLRDTTDLDMDDMEIEGTMKMHLNYKNGFPVKLAAKIILADDKYSVLSEVNFGEISAATVDASGDVTARTSGKLEVTLDNNQVQDFNKAKYIFIDATIDTPGTNPVAFSTKPIYGLDINLALEASVEYEIK